MKIKVTKIEEFVVIPSIYKDEEKPPKFKFRTLNSSDMLKYYWANDTNAILYDTFIGFENKIEIVDENDKPIEYETYKEFIELGLSGDIALIHSECVTEMAKRLENLTKVANATEKKSEQPTKSSKADKQVIQNT